MHWIDPNSLPETRGVIRLFLRDAKGKLNGMILEDDLEVHFPRHMSEMVSRHLESGDEIGVLGVRPRAGELIAAVAIRTSGGKLLLDEGPKADKERKEEQRGIPDAEKATRLQFELRGRVLRLVHGAKGEVTGALLDEGTILRFPKEAECAAQLIPGAEVCIRGDGLKDEMGAVVEVKEFAASPDSLVPVRKGKKEHRKGHKNAGSEAPAS